MSACKLSNLLNVDHGSASSSHSPVSLLPNPFPLKMY